MAYKYSEKRQTRQEETAFIAYMIIGSYFKKETCRNHFAAERLYLYYRDMGVKKQEFVEEKIISRVDKALRNYASELALMNCESTIRFRDKKYILEFITGFERIIAEVDKRGNLNIIVVG